MKKSIALLAVLGFIIILITLSLSFFKIYEKYSTNSYLEISQDSILIKNITSILNNLSKDINDSQIQKIFNKYPPISSKNGDFIVNIEITPLNNKINLNQYIENNKTNSYIDDTLSSILQFYEISDPIFFKNLILDSIDSDLIERDAYSEIKLNDSKFQNGEIYNQKHFQKILDYYVLKTNNKDIYKIPWNQYIFFDKQKQILDCDLIDKKLADFIGLEIKNDIISCENIDIKQNKKILQNLNIKSFSKSETYLINIKVNYILNDSKNNLNIKYDIKNKKVISIEKHSIY